MLTEYVYPNRFFLASIGDRDFFAQDGFIECRNREDEIVFVSDEIGGKFIYECTNLFVRGNVTIKVFDGSTGEFKKEIPGYLLFNDNFISQCSLLVADYRKDLPAKLSRLNLKTEYSEWTIDFSRGTNCFIEDGTAYIEKDLDKRNLYAINLENGNIRWQFDISKFGTYLDPSKNEQPYHLLQIVGSHNGLLWLVISAGRLLALNAQTGQLIHELNFNEILGEFYYAGTGQMFLDKDNNRIIWIRTGLIHIDLVSLKCIVVREYFQGVEKKDRWLLGDRLMHKNKIFFAGDLGMYNPAVFTFIGIMDVDTGEIIWKTQLLKCDGIYVGSLKVSRNKIYARDGKGSLHVFEQEIDF